MRLPDQFLPRAILLAVAFSMLLSGCASSGVPRRRRMAAPPEPEPEIPPVYRSVRPDGLPPDDTYRPFTNRAVRAFAPAPAAAPLPLPEAAVSAPAGPVSKDWRVQLSLGQRRASVNGVELWLCEPAVVDRSVRTAKGAKPKLAPGPTDRRLTLGPLMGAPTNAFVRAPRPPRIMIDPGHGGSDPGTTAGNLRESAIAMDIAKRLGTYLARSGYDVRLTRPGDKSYVALEQRCRLASAWPADLFVSIHLNSGPSAAHGIETYAIPPAGQLSTEAATRKTVSPAARAAAARPEPGNRNDRNNIRLAWCIHRRLLAATQRSDRGIRRARYTVLRESTVPAVLVEVGFLSNAGDAAFYATASGRDKAAVGLCRGIMDFCAGHIAPTHPPLPIGPPAAPEASR